MKKTALCLALAPLLAVAGCGGGYYGGGYGYGPVGYDGYYDGYYGPIYDGYWGDDGAFWYRGHGGDRRFRRGDPGHFARGGGPGPGPGGGFQPMHGSFTPGRGMRAPHFGGGGMHGPGPGGGHGHH